MNRLLAGILLAVSLAVYIAATVPDITRWIIDKGVILDPHKLGDMYYYSRLPEFKRMTQQCNYHAAKVTAKRKVKLFVMGDSFTASIPAESFSANSYAFAHWDYQTEGVLDTGMTNVLIIETVERAIRERFSVSENTIIDVSKGDKEETRTGKYLKTPMMVPFIKYFFGEGVVEKGIESVLFENKPARLVRELKASMNYYLFGRIDDKVILSSQMRVLYYHTEAAPEEGTSSFNTISNEEISSIVSNINSISDHYRKLGFDKVVFSLVPNKVSIYEPGWSYNHLIDRIQSDSALKEEIINMYAPFKKLGAETYLFNDTHWSCVGRDMWLDSVNARIMALAVQ